MRHLDHFKKFRVISNARPSRRDCTVW